MTCMTVVIWFTITFTLVITWCTNNLHEPGRKSSAGRKQTLYFPPSSFSPLETRTWKWTIKAAVFLLHDLCFTHSYGLHVIVCVEEAGEVEVPREVRASQAPSRPCRVVVAQLPRRPLGGAARRPLRRANLKTWDFLPGWPFPLSHARVNRYTQPMTPGREVPPS